MQVFENSVGKGEIACNVQFLLFSQCFLPIWTTICHFPQIRNCRLQTLSVWKSLKFVVWERVNSVWLQFLEVFILSFGVDQRTYSCFHGVIFYQFSARYSSKAIAAFPHNDRQNSGQQRGRNEFCRNDYYKSPERNLPNMGSN